MPSPWGEALPQCGSLLGLPIVFAGQTRGVVLLGFDLDEPSSVDLELLTTVVAQAAGACERSQLQRLAVQDPVTGAFAPDYFRRRVVDEISLAEDSVLERLNSVLDPARLLVLPEKGSELEELYAAPQFRLLATMNPGGDFGKKELSPALRNRFTEVWVPAISARRELLAHVGDDLAPLAEHLLERERRQVDAERALDDDD